MSYRPVLSPRATETGIRGTKTKEVILLLSTPILMKKAGADVNAQTLQSGSNTPSGASGRQSGNHTANPTSDSDSATSKTGNAHPATTDGVHDEEQLWRSMRSRRTPLRDDDDRFARTYYTSKPRSHRSITIEEVEDEDVPPRPQQSAAPAASGSSSTSDSATTSVGTESAKALTIQDNPLTYEEAMACAEADEWRKECAIELEQFVLQKLSHSANGLRTASSAANGSSSASTARLGLSFVTRRASWCKASLRLMGSTTKRTRRSRPSHAMPPFAHSSPSSHAMDGKRINSTQSPPSQIRRSIARSS